MKNYRSLFFVILIILFLLLFLQLIEPTIGTTLSSILTTCTTIVGFVSVFYEMKRSADIDECNFILETFKHFTANTNVGITTTYEKLDLLFFEGKNTFTKNDRKHIVQYLQFFEMLAGLIKKDSLSISDIDDLYAYPFFIAVNCSYIQEIELLPYKEYYNGIFGIYSEWINYRKKYNKSIPFSDTLLISNKTNK